MISSTKALIFALFSLIFLFSSNLDAADAGCHKREGCQDLYNTTPYQNPTYAPSWTDVTTILGHVRGGQYIKFSVVEGEVYQWSTEGSEDIFNGSYSSVCNTENDCRTAADVESQGLRCLGHYCLLPFDTELTLLKGESCSANSEFLAYSNSNGFRNQSQIEWKADFTGTVVLLVTNYAYNASDDSFSQCQKTTGTTQDGWDMTTTVKWHRTSSEHCSTCGKSDWYIQDKTGDDFAASQAPAWKTIQQNSYVSASNLTEYLNAMNSTWIKPGSYLVFKVKENEIYRWSTCVSELHDTQLTLFKGRATTDNCGEFLAFGDDSKVSYDYNDNNYCPDGTRQTLLEWQANFTGEVTLLFNEYNCSQCYPQELPTGNSWLGCFEVTEKYKTDANNDIVVENGWPVPAQEGDSSAKTATFWYTFPLDWQRYDCQCGTTRVKKVDDYSANAPTGSIAFVNDTSMPIANGEYVEFHLKRGSKYLFQTQDPDAIITIKKGSDCEGDTFAQATGQLAYFADSTEYDSVNFTYNADVISVYVSSKDCGTGSNVLTYSYYNSVKGANVKTRFSLVEVGADILVTDQNTALQFVDTGKWATTWKEAVTTCQNKTVGGSDDDEDVLACPQPICPNNSHYDDNDAGNNEYFCRYRSTGAGSDGKCFLPTCSTSGYSEFQKTEANKDNESLQDVFGKCYFSRNNSGDCDSTNTTMTNPTTHTLQLNRQCPTGYEKHDALCYKCADGYTLQKILALWKCVKTECDSTQRCVTKGAMCSYLGVGCSGDFIEDDETGRCYNPNAGELVNIAPSDGSFHDATLDNEVSYGIDTCSDVNTCMNSSGDGCQEGWEYDSTINQCIRCSDSANVPYKRRDGLWACRPDCGEDYVKTTDDPPYQKCASCPEGEAVMIEGDHENAKCVVCGEGRSAVMIGEDFFCVKECDQENHIIKGDYCYPSSSSGDCKQGWVQDPANAGKCRKLQTSSNTASGYVSVTCRAGVDPKDNEPGRTCDLSNNYNNINSYDCDCHEDYCEDPTTVNGERDDRKVCPNPYLVPYSCVVNHIPTTCYDSYTIDGNSVETAPFELNGETIQVVKVCHFTDKTNQACGEKMGGWTLPNINQLYSIVDFDLYDPASPYPFDSDGYNMTESSTTQCHPDKSDKHGAACESQEDCDSKSQCLGGKCISTDPYGDNQCGGKMWICMNNKCVRNNWYWSSTTVVSENEDDGKFTWAVNIEDGRSYRAVKGCTGNECAQNVDLTARPHHVLCIKGTTLVGIFDADAPTMDQAFSGWVCDAGAADDPVLAVYFEIRDSKNKDVVDLLGNDADDTISMTIPGQLHKGIKYGFTDNPAQFMTSGKESEIYNNCGFHEVSTSNPHAFGVKWREGETSEDKAAVVAEILKIKTILECSSERLDDDTDPKSDCAIPPYFVTAYGAKDDDGSSAVAISPTNRPFVFTNRCGDGHKTNDGTYTETCEVENFATRCAYGIDCELCSKKTVGDVKACTFYTSVAPKCMDGTLQSYYCVDSSTAAALTEDGDQGVVSAGHVGAGEQCEFYNFAATNNIGSSEECDCSDGEAYHLYSDKDHFDCNTPITSAVCPDYNTLSNTQYSLNPDDENGYCYICSGCKRVRTAKGRCGDGKVNRRSCAGYTGTADCVEVANIAPEQEEECDDANTSNTDGCTNDCKLPECGDGYIQGAAGEVCDSGIKNGYYETNCDSDDVRCPGCASMTCGKLDPETGELTDALGPRCGDNIVQNIAKCGEASFISTYGPIYGFSDETTCRTKMNGAEEKCDLGDGNNVPIKFDDFLATSDAAGCFGTVNNVTYPVNGIHTNFAECVYKYWQYIQSHSGCSSDCKTPQGPYCGDGVKDPGEFCDDGLPVALNDAGEPELQITLTDDGKYVISSSFADKPYNGKNYNNTTAAKGGCRLDCKAKYNCENGDTEIDGEGSCKPVAGETFSTFGFTSEEYGRQVVKICVKDGAETCDDGALTGNYGYCDHGCKIRAFCGSGSDPENPDSLNCIQMADDGITCLKKETCDNGTTGTNANKPNEQAYSTQIHGSCVADVGCDNTPASEWGDRVCCEWGRYCGDGTVDNGSKVNDATTWKTAANWTVSGASVTYDPRNLSLRFSLTGDTATAELNIDVPIDLNLRYLLEFNVMPILPSGDEFTFEAGVNEYDASGNKLENAAYGNASPYFFVTSLADCTDCVRATSNGWYRGKNAVPIKGESEGGSNTWYSGTKKVKIFFRMTAVEGTDFLIRALSFYDIAHARANYEGSIDSSSEMCDPGSDKFAPASNYYMTDCNSSCEWINRCGDSVVQRNTDDCVDGKYNGQTCVGGIDYASEVCDNGTNETNVYNGCEPGCMELGPRCGDGYVDKTNCASGSGATCHTPTFINNDKEEQCDKGALNSNTSVSGIAYNLTNYGTCREDCRPSRCGDGVLDTVKLYDGTEDPETIEECDCGAPGAYFEETKNQTTEVNGQIVSICVADDGTELYNTISAQRAVLCRPNCKISRCGDGILDQIKDESGNVISGEECDDGNFNDHDSCTTGCKFNVVGDGILAHSRSYLCEELKNLSEAEMQLMASKGVVDCDGTNPTTCADLADAIKTDADVKTYFEQNILHCCYNQKLGGGVDDHNCERKVDNTPTSPKDIAIARCESYAKTASGENNTSISPKTHDECVALEKEGGRYAAWEQCELCTDEKCGRDCDAGDTKCFNQQVLNCSTNPLNTTQTLIDDCIEQNRYCDDTGWNVYGRCGDGKVDESAGESCDRNVDADTRYYTDLYDGRIINTNAPWAGENTSGWYNGRYCTGPCRGTCTQKSPMCSGSGDNNCWTEGCTYRLHRNGSSTDQSTCGDGFLDIYAGENCDYGVSKHDSDWTKSYCNSNCQYNRKNGTEAVAKCGDGQIQSLNEVCDDGNELDNDYCVADPNGSEDNNGVLGHTNHCQVYYGSCGDGKITGPGYAIDSKWNPGNGGGVAGPEDCDLNDARTLSLINAEVSVDTLCTANCKRHLSCGDGLRNPRFEGCDFSVGDGSGSIEITYQVFGTGGEKTRVEKCFAGCKSNPKGGLIKATSSEISGWACDPDHPMTHPDKLVNIEIYDKDGNFVGSKELKTTKDVEGTDYFGDTRTVNDIIEECGGGKLHGWTYDVLRGEGMNWENKLPPFTVKAFVRSIDYPDYDEDFPDAQKEDREVFIGEKSFLTSMRCGDAVISGCDTIEVTMLSTQNETWAEGRVCNDADVVNGCAHYGLVNGEACANVEDDPETDNDETFNCAEQTVKTIVRTPTAWSHGRTCLDSEVDGGCERYGLINNESCVDEQCDNGSNNNDQKDCDLACQWTYCGDKKVQDLSTGEPNPRTVNGEERPWTVVAAEECDYTSTNCQTIMQKENTSDTINNQAVNCNNDACKWNRNVCILTSKCPDLTTAITGWTDDNGGAYTASHIDDYVEYNSGANSQNNPSYDRPWAGNGWSAAQTSVQYFGNTAENSEARKCSFTCKYPFEWGNVDEWGNGKCKPRTDITVPCNTCPDGSNGVWLDAPTVPCTESHNVSQTITLNSDGSIKKQPAVGTTNFVPSAYGTAADPDKCIWKCNSTSTEVTTTSGKECWPNEEDHVCTGKPDGMVWISVKLDSNGDLVYDIPSDGVLKIPRTLDLDPAHTATTYHTYIPSDSDMIARRVDNDTNGAKAEKDAGNLSKDAPRFCFYTCPTGKYFDPADSTCKEIKCGDGKIQNEDCTKVTAGSCYFMFGKDELCDDGNATDSKPKGDNGQYNSGDKSHCDEYCGSYSACMAANGNNADACSFIKAAGYNGRIGSTTSNDKGDYFCGDGKTQYTGSCTGTDCKEVTSNNYPGAIISAFTTSEMCDTGSGADTTRLTLCKRANPGDAGMQALTSESQIYAASGDYKPSCKTGCQEIQDSDKNTGCNYCGDGVIGGSEQCESAQTTAQMCQGEMKEYYSNTPATKTLTSSYKSYAEPLAIENAEIKQNLLYNSDSKFFYVYSDYNTYFFPGWRRSSSYTAHTSGYPICTTSQGDAYSKAYMEFTITPTASGEICFWWKGESESGYDKFTYKLNGDAKINGVSGSNYSTYRQQCDDVTAGVRYTLYFEYTKDKNTDSGIDTFCIDDITVPIPVSVTENPSTVSCDSSCQKSGKCYGYCGDAEVEDDAPMKSDLVYLKFNEGSSSTTTANFGSLGGAYTLKGGSRTSDGRFGGAYTFNGGTEENTYFLASNLNYENYYDNFTMMAWVKPTQTITTKTQSDSGTNATSGQKYLFGAQHGQNTGNAGAGLSIGTNAILVTAHAASYMPPLAVKTADLSSGWHHVAVVFNDKTPSIYLDGSLIHTGVKATKTHVWISNMIGGGNYDGFVGSVDDVKLFNKVLSAYEIRELMNAAEACDRYDATTNTDSWTQNKHCNAGCSGWGPYCGDGIRNGTETCDTGSSSIVCVKRSSSSAACGSGCNSGNCYTWKEYTLDCSSCSSYTLTATGTEKKISVDQVDPATMDQHWCREYVPTESNYF